VSLNEIRRIAWQTIVEALGFDVATDAALLLQLKTYTVLTLPTAASYPRGIIYVSDQSTGAEPAFSDGTNWRIFSTRAVVS
jgi:hypothetical protein